MSRALFAFSTTKFSVFLAVLICVGLIGVGFRPGSLPFSPASDFSDAAISRYPDALYFQRSLRDAHTLPLWNPHLMGGQPFAANPGTKVWYPFTWLLLLWSPTLHINAMIGLHLWLAGVGMWLWARRSGMRIEAAGLAAVAYAISPKLVAHAGVGHLDLLIAAAWLPFLLLAILRLFTEKITFPLILLLAVAAAMIFIGAIQLTPFLYGVGLVYGMMLWWQGGSQTRPYKWIALAALLVLGFTAAQWLPLIDLRSSVSRGDIRPQDAALLSMEAGQFVGLLIGDQGGNPESLAYVGVSVFVLAVLGLILRPRQNRIWWVVVIGASLYTLGDHFWLWSGLVELLPPLLWFRVPSRAWFLVALLLPYLAGWGVQFLLETPPDSARARLITVGFVGLGLTCALSSLVFLNEALKTATLIGIFALPLTAILIALGVFRRVETRYLLAVFLLVVMADCLWMDRSLIEGRASQDWLQKMPPAPLVGMAGRLYTPDYAIPQQDTAYWGVPRFDGVDPFQLEAFVKSAEIATGIPREGYSTTVPAEVVLETDPDSFQYRNAPMDAQLLGLWGVEWVVTGYPISVDGLRLEDQLEGRYFYKNDFYWGDAVRLEWENPNRLRQFISTDAPVLTAAYAKGWQKDGEAIDSDSAGLPPESATFTYSPASVYRGLAISLVTYLLAGVGLLGSLRRAR